MSILSASQFKSVMIFVAWFLVCALGFIKLIDYETRPGQLGEPPSHWPTHSQLMRSSDKPTLVFFAHPQCPCTQASMTELSKLMAHIEDQINLNIVFYKPEKYDHNWVKTSLYFRAKKLTESVTIDVNKQEIHLFKPKTSGQAYLYDRNGSLVYSGGLTASRGHEGDNLGSQRIRDFILKGKDVDKKFLVFGCSLFHNGESLKHERSIGSLSHVQ